MGIEVLMFVMFGIIGGQGGELLDFVESEQYWVSRDERVVDIATMSAVLKDADERPAADKLMAIRALGELGKVEDADKQAVLKILEPLVKSNEPFVGQFAKRSIAWVKGADPELPTPATAEQLSADLALLPKSSMLVGQMKINNTGQLASIADFLPSFGPQAAEQRKEMLDSANKELLKLIAAIGNVRVDAVSMGLTFTGNGDDGFAMVVGRGKYDPLSVQIAFEELEEDGGLDFNFYSIGEVEVIASNQRHEHFAIMMPSDDTFIIFFGEPGDKGVGGFPIAESAKRIAAGSKAYDLEAQLAAEVEKVDRKNADVWVAMTPKGPFLTERGISDIFGGYKSAHAVAKRDTEGGYDVTWQAEGINETKVAAAVAFVNESIEEGTADMKRQMNQMPPEMKPMFEPMVKMMESMKFEQDGNAMKGGMKLDSSVMMTPFMMFGAIR